MAHFLVILLFVGVLVAFLTLLFRKLNAGLPTPSAPPSDDSMPVWTSAGGSTMDTGVHHGVHHGVSSHTSCDVSSASHTSVDCGGGHH